MHRLRSPEGIEFRDLNHNGTMEPYEDPTRPVAERVRDLVSRMSLAEKAGTMFCARVIANPDGGIWEGRASDLPFPLPLTATSTLVSTKFISSVAMMYAPPAASTAAWTNAMQELASGSRLGIPMTIASDPRHGRQANLATSVVGGGFSAGPEPIGLGAISDAELIRDFAAMTARELRAVGITLALHPMADLATEPRWSRIVGTFGEDPHRVATTVQAYINGMQGPSLSPQSVACMTKHFPGGGAQKDGTDPHFADGREQVYPGGRFEDHLIPFQAAIESGTAQIMPYYSIPIGTDYEEVGFAFNKGIITALLRGRFGFNGVVCSDFNILSGMSMPDGIPDLPARSWGVEHLSQFDQLVRALDAGVDMFGGEECTELIIRAVNEGRITLDRIDSSVARILADKFRLGLFDNPFVCERTVETSIGSPENLNIARRARLASSVPLTPLTTRPTEGSAVYLENLDAEIATARGLRVVTNPEDAEVAILRLSTPYDPATGLLEQSFHSGRLDFTPAEQRRLAELAARVPIILDVFMDRPAILTELLPACAGAIATFGVDDETLLDIVMGDERASGTLPFDLPSSMSAVEQSHPDAPFGTADPLLRAGHRADWSYPARKETLL